MLVGIVANVGKVLQAGFLDAYLADGDAEQLHEVDGIGVGAVGSAEAWHGDADDAAPVHAELVEGSDADEQGQRAVQTSADADHDGLCSGVLDALCQSVDLYVEDFLAAFVEPFAGGHEGVRVDGAGQGEGTGRHALGVDDGALLAELCGAAGEGGVHAAFGLEAFHVNLCLERLRLQLVALGLCKQGAVLVDESFAAEDHILCALAVAAAAEDVAADGACALLCQQGLQVGVLAHGIAVGAEVEDDVGSL